MDDVGGLKGTLGVRRAPRGRTAWCGALAILAIGLGAGRSAHAEYHGFECGLAENLLKEHKTAEATQWARVCIEKGGQPAGFSGATPGTPPSTQRLAPDPRWIAQLPTVADVQRLSRGANPADTAVRQQTAFYVLCKFVLELSGTNSSHTERMPPEAYRRYQEYDDTQTRTPGGSAVTLDQAYRNAKQYAHQKAVLDALVPKVSADAYWSTPAGRTVMAQAQADAAQATARAQVAESDRQASAAAAAELARNKARIAPDLAAAKQANIDLSVLGIRLGEPLVLPECGANEKSFVGMMGVAAPSPSQSCRSDAHRGLQDQIVQLKEQWTGEGGPASVAGVTTTSVRIADTKCPDWVKSFGVCMADVSLQGTLVVGVNLLVSGDQQAKITAQLTKKYGRPTGQGDGIVCKNKMTGLVVARAVEERWSLRGLHVSYMPLRMEDCARGVIAMQLASYRRRQGEAEARKQENEPQL